MFSSATITVLATFAAAFEFARKDSVAGHLVPKTGWSRVTASRNAVVRVCNVVNGQQVEAGDVLLELSSGHGVGSGMPVGRKLLSDIAKRKRTLATRIQAGKAAYEQDRQNHEVQAKSLEDQEGRLTEELQAHRRRVAVANQRLLQARTLMRQRVLSESDGMALVDELEARKGNLASKGRELERCWATSSALTVGSAIAPRTSTLSLRRLPSPQCHKC